MGVAMRGLLFLRFLNCFGLQGAVAPPHTELRASAEMLILSFQKVWDVIAVLGSMAIVISFMRGGDARPKAPSN